MTAYTEFTGKERDAETGLDYFGARYFSGAQGRFTSADPVGIMKQKMLDPQQWNMYAYARNNPLAVIDPDGAANFAVFDNFSRADLVSNTRGARPNWTAIKATAEANGHTVTLYSGPSATVQNYETAISTPGMNVIDVGHSVETNGFTTAVGVDLAAGGVGNGFMGNGQALTPAGDVQADSVNIFACNSSTLSGQYSGAQTFTGVQSGANGTNAITLEAAGAAFLTTATSQPAAKPVDLAGAAAAAQTAISTSKVLTPQVGGGRPININTGDRVVQLKKPEDQR